MLQVRDGVLQVLLWQRAQEPFSGAWALPGGVVSPDETLEASIRRHLAAKVDLAEVAHLEQVATYGDPGRNPVEWEIATAYLGLVPLGVDPSVPDDTSWQPVDALPTTAFDHGAIVHSARERLRGKLSYSNIGFALAPATFTLNELRAVYAAALGYDVSATNLKRVLDQAWRPRAHRRSPRPGSRRGSSRGGVRVLRAVARDHRSVRRPPAARPPAAVARLNRGQAALFAQLGRLDHEPRSVGAEPVARELDRRAVGRVADPLDEQQRRAAPDAERARIGRARLDQLEPLDGARPAAGRSRRPSGRSSEPPRSMSSMSGKSRGG